MSTGTGMRFGFRNSFSRHCHTHSNYLLALLWRERMEVSDFVSLHVPLNEATEGLIGPVEMGLMKPGAFLINVARGRVVDRAALLAALREQRLAGAGLDVFWNEPPDPDDPFLAMPNVIATPHVANMTLETIETIARVSADNIRRVQAGLPPMHQIQ
ncbi:MAG: NAD(P)-dependent oxidoreductase [Candidatus Binatia bacterium]